MAEMGHQVTDVGPDASDSVDYPDFAFEVSSRVSKGDAERGVLICGTGIGMCIAANKLRGVRAAPCHDSITAEMSRRHNNANVLALGARIINVDAAFRIVDTWLTTQFAGGRHERRVEKIMAIEKKEDAAGASRNH